MKYSMLFLTLLSALFLSACSTPDYKTHVGILNQNNEIHFQEDTELGDADTFTEIKEIFLKEENEIEGGHAFPFTIHFDRPNEYYSELIVYFSVEDHRIIYHLSSGSIEPVYQLSKSESEYILDALNFDAARYEE